VPLSPLAFRSLAATAAPADGDEGEPSLVVCGRVVSGKERPAVLEAAAALTAAGLEIAELSTDARGRVVGVWSQPDFRDGQAVERSAALLAHRYHDHLQRRCS